MMTKIKPCPFCGSEDIAVLREKHFYVFCRDCGASGPSPSPFTQWKEKQNAIMAWNYRAECDDDDLVRKCDVCGRLMFEGFCVNDGEYYCSETCLHSKYTDEEYTDLFNSNEAYWTTWED